MKIILNGDIKNIDKNITIDNLFKFINIDSSKIMGIAINMNIIKKENWEKHKIQEDDKIEILNFVAGG